MVDFLHEAPHAFHGSVALLRGTGGGDAGREDERRDQGKYVLGTDRQVVASLKDDLPYVGQAQPAAQNSAPSCGTKQLAAPKRSGAWNAEDLTVSEPSSVSAANARTECARAAGAAEIT